ncbi:MAG: hypothetical protein ACLP05_09315 [Candidatus Kryptoniota bacterium]
MKSILLFIKKTKTPFLGLFLLFMCINTAYSQEGGAFHDYVGNMGDSAVGFTFVDTGDVSDSLVGRQLSGSYFFVDKLKDIQFSGVSKTDRSIELYQRDDKGNSVGHLIGAFPKTDPKGGFEGSTLQDEIITGTWYTGKATVGLTVYLKLESAISRAPNGQRYSLIGVKNDSVFETEVRNFKDAVLRGDSLTVSKGIAYPIKVNIDGKTRRIRNKSAFLHDYDKIMYPKLFDAIRKSIPHNMFVNDEGAMLGDGIVWFDATGRVIALNN